MPPGGICAWQPRRRRRRSRRRKRHVNLKVKKEKKETMKWCDVVFLLLLSSSLCSSSFIFKCTYPHTAPVTEERQFCISHDHKINLFKRSAFHFALRFLWNRHTHTHTQSARTHAPHNAYSINMQKRMRKKSSKVKSFTHKLSIGNNSKQPLRSSWQGGGDKTRQVVIDMRQCVHTTSRNVKNVGDTTVNKHVHAHTCMCVFTCVIVWVCVCVGFCSRLELLKYSHHYEPRLRTQAAQKAL